MTTDAVREKALRLLEEGRIEPDLVPDRVFTVIGDTATYWPVVIEPERHFCPCRRGQETPHQKCSHVEACEEWVLAEQARITGEDPSRNLRYENALMGRKHRESGEYEFAT